MKKRILSFIMAMSMVFAMGLDMKSFAANVSMTIDGSSAYSQYQGVGKFTVSITNNSGNDINNATLVFTSPFPGGVKPSGNQTVDLKNGITENRDFEVGLYGATMGPIENVNATLFDSSGINIANASKQIYVNPIDPIDIGNENLPTVDEKDYTFKPDNTINYNSQVKLEVIAPKGGMNPGATNNVQLKVTNTGNAPFNKVVASIATLGDKMSLKNAPTNQDLGPMGKGKSQTVSFPIYIENSHEGGNVPISFSVKATDPKSAVAEFSITEYVVVNAGTSLADQLEIVNIKNPSKVNPDQDFNLSFAVRNGSGQAAKNVKVTVEPTAPVVNKTKNIFVINLAPGESRAFNVQMFVPKTAENQAQNFPIKITAETTGKDASSISQYSGVFVNTSTDKTVPQIIITNYSYGGSSAVANEVFPLRLTLKNTNTRQALKNIKVSLNAEEGVFIPHNSSNSFYVASIAPGGSVVKTVEMMTIPEAPEKTTAINVDMTYEDDKGNQIAVKDIISVPVVQQRRLEIDDVDSMDELYVGQQANISVQYYNMGKSTLNNLIISAEGDFEFPQSTKTFVGKLEAGKNDYYDLALIPTHPGEADGKLIFSFEDSSGKEIVIEKPFRLIAGEMPPMEPTDEIPMEEPGLTTLQKVGIGVGAAVLAGALVLYRRKKKKQKDILDIDDEE